MTRKRLLLAGWFAMASALLTIPWFILTFSLAEQKDSIVKMAEVAMLVTSTLLTIYLLLTLLRLLHSRYGFDEADTPLGMIIKVNVVTAAVTILGLFFPSLESGLAIFALLAVIALGGLQVFFGLRLLQLPATFQGLHKPYCYLNIVTGICLASVVLLPLGILTGAVADVMLGTIFFHVAAPSE